MVYSTAQLIVKVTKIKIKKLVFKHYSTICAHVIKKSKEYFSQSLQKNFFLTRSV